MPHHGQPQLPEPRGPLSAFVIETLRGCPGLALAGPPTEADPLVDDDFGLALYVLYELHYRSFRGVDDRWEWDPSLLAFRGRMEASFETALVDDARGSPSPEFSAGADTAAKLRALIEADDGPSLSRYLENRADVGEMLEFLVHRSAYQLKEADPHSWVLPRISGAAKAALVEIQADEYGGGDAERIHAFLFAQTMEAVGLDSRYGAYLDRLPGTTLATVNLMSFFGLHRRWCGAIIGHLAVFEMTSTLPNRRYGNCLRRLGFGAQACDFFDEHVEADAVHENIAAHDMAGALAREQGLEADILFGATALIRADQRFAETVLDNWQEGRSSLLAAPDSEFQATPAPALAE